MPRKTPTDIGTPPVDTVKVAVESNADVIKSLGSVVNNLATVIEELKKTQIALSIIFGEDIDLEGE